MTVQVHPTARVDPAATLGVDVVVGPFAIVGPGVRLDDGVTIGARVTLEGDTRVGAGSTIGTGSVLGAAPQDRKYRSEPTSVTIGAHADIREYVTVHRGTASTGSTTVGDRCFLMTYSHVAHDCHLADDVVLGNAVQLAGHVQMAAHAQIGGLTPVHQFVRIGTHAFVGGGSRVPQDVPPYALTAGNPMRIYGLNTEGLRRAGFDPSLRLTLKRAFRLLFNSDLARPAAMDRIQREHGHVPEVAHLLEFVSESHRGVLV